MDIPEVCVEYFPLSETDPVGSEQLDLRARIAIKIIESNSIIAAIPDGYDPVGRQKLRVPTGDEVAQQACDIASSLVELFEQNDWIRKKQKSVNELIREAGEHAGLRSKIEHETMFPRHTADSSKSE